MKVNVKKLHRNAVIPTYAKHGDAGLDLVATSFETDGDYIEYGIGLAFEIPVGFVGLVFPRSSVSKTSLGLANSVAVVDAGYRGEIKLRFKALGNQESPIYNVGDRVAQMIIIPFPKVRLAEVSELSDTERGDGGFGSSGN